MNGIFWLLRLLTFYSLVLAIRSVDPERQPLIFDSYTLQYYLDWGRVTNEVPLGSFAAACPPVEKGEIKFNQNDSLDRKCLFVQYYVKEKTDPFICSQFLELSAVIHSEPDKEPFIEFGYEVYFDKSTYTELLKTSVLENFSPVSQPLAWHKRASKDSKKKVGVSSKIPSMKKIDPNNPKRTINQKLGFLWFSKMVIRYDFDAWNINSFSYFVTKNPEDLLVGCTSDSLGQAFYGKDFLQTYYNKQEKIFSNANLPTTKKDICTTAHKCVKKFNLLPPYQLRSYNTLSISCSDLTSVPVWYENTEALLNYSEQFLVAMAAETESKIEVTTGTYEVLKLSIKGSSQAIYLNTKEKRIPVPRIIYKIVKYQSFKIGTVVERCAYIMVIVIHNEPDNAQIEEICDDKCELLGWENIQYMTTQKNDKSVKSNHIYCCKLDVNLANALRDVIDEYVTDDLDLNGFPYFNDGWMVRQDRKDMYEKKMRDLFPSKPSIPDYLPHSEMFKP